EVENTLSIKADKQTVDDLTGVVDLQALDIKANADGLKLKANQDTVDLIDGRVSSLGTEVSQVAGQISNKVWNTDIETAIDGIEVGGRNLIPNSNDFSEYTGYRGAIVEQETGVVVEEWGATDATRLIVTNGSHNIKTAPSVYSDYKGTLTYSYWVKNNGNEPVEFHYNGFPGTGKTHVIYPG